MPVPLFQRTARPSGRSPGILRSGAISIFDQGVVSGASFLTTLILARACSVEELGAYSLAGTVVIFLTAIQGNLVTVPYTMYCHRRDGCELAEYSGSTLTHQLLTSLAAVLCFLVMNVLASFECAPESLKSAACVLMAAVPFILLREFARRFSFAHLALATVLSIDVVAAILQVGALLLLQNAGILSAAAVYGVSGASCAVACVCWLFLDRRPIRFRSSRFIADWKQNWTFGKWTLLSQIAGISSYLLPWLLAAVHGEAATGRFAACAALVGLSHLFVIGLNNLLAPKTARAFAEGGAGALAGVLKKAVFLSVVVLGGLCVVVYFAGNAVAEIVYGAKYAGTGPLIAMLAAAALADSVGLAASAGILAMDRPETNIAGDVVQLVVTLAIAVWLVGPAGPMGIAVAMFAGRTAGAVARWATLNFLASRGLSRLSPSQ